MQEPLMNINKTTPRVALCQDNGVNHIWLNLSRSQMYIKWQFLVKKKKYHHIALSYFLEICPKK